MDILNLTKEGIREMSITEYESAISYCWVTYTQRRNDFWTAKLIKAMASMFGVKWNTGEQSDDKQTTLNLDFSSQNPVHQELERQRNIPKKFLDEVNK
jgi:hypothetical protein